MRTLRGLHRLRAPGWWSRYRQSSKGAGELTFRAFLIGALLTVLFTTANVYFGLKSALTFASSIPASVISMAVLRSLRRGSIVENNIVQTIASAAGALSAMVFVLPAFLITGWWASFPFWTTYALCASGGTLGVVFTVPLRRLLVVDGKLPYPEGIACAEVLKVGMRDQDAVDSQPSSGMRILVAGALASFSLACAQAYLHLSDRIALSLRLGRGATNLETSLSLALFGVGQLVGWATAFALGIGTAVAWLILIPLLYASAVPVGTPSDGVAWIWSHQMRFVGAGAIAATATWSLVGLARPLGREVRALARVRVRGVTSRRSGSGDEDMPTTWLLATSLIALAIIGTMLWRFAADAGFRETGVTAGALGLLFVLVVGFLVAGVCGLMAGLVGSSNSPITGVGMLGALGSALALLLLRELGVVVADNHGLVAFALFVTSFVFAVGVIANDNLQDLKTGQLVGATPWKQQVALIFGVLVGAAVIPTALNLIAGAYRIGAAGGATHPALAAPQANLIAALTSGVLTGALEWSLVGWGAALGALVIVVDAQARAAGRRGLPPLAFGLGLYLPIATASMIVLGAATGEWQRRRNVRLGRQERELERTLMASGFIVGEGLAGILIAASAIVLGTAVSVSDSSSFEADALSLALFAGALWGAWRLAGNRQGSDRTQDSPS